MRVDSLVTGGVFGAPYDPAGRGYPEDQGGRGPVPIRRVAHGSDMGYPSIAHTDTLSSWSGGGGGR